MVHKYVLISSQFIHMVNERDQYVVVCEYIFHFDGSLFGFTMGVLQGEGHIEGEKVKKGQVG